MADSENRNASDHTGTTPNSTQTQPAQPPVQAPQEENRVVLSAPVEGQYQTVAVVPGMTLQVAFDLSQVNVDRIGKDLYLFFDESGSIVLKGFALFENNAQAPKFLLPDGTELTSKMLLSALDQTDIEPATGASAQGGGVGEYQDDPGAILKGIDKLDGLDFAQTQDKEATVIASYDAATAPIETNTDVEEELPITPPYFPDDPPYIDVEDGGLSNDNTPAIDGTAEPGSTIIVEVGGVTMATITDADGNWSVTVPDGHPLPDGVYTVTATATDAAGNIATDTGSVGVDATPPVIISAEVSDDGATLTGLTEPDAVVIATLPDGMQVEVTADEDGTFTIDLDTPLIDGEDITLEAEDALGNRSDDYPVRAPSAPEAGDVDFTTNEDTAIVITQAQLLADATDADSTDLSVTSAHLQDPATGTLVANPDGTWTFTPAENFHGEDVVIDFTVSDGALTDNASARIDVLPVSDAFATHDTAETTEERSVDIDVLANDTLADGAALTSFDATSANGGIISQNADGTLHYIPAVNFEGTDTFSYTITDEDGSASTAIVTVAVNNIDDFAVVHESALADGSGRVETILDDTPEAGQAAGQGTTLATGSLLANDGGASAVLQINGVSAVEGIITVNGSQGQLVYDTATDTYRYTLSGPVDNSAPGNDLSVVETFTYSNDLGSTANLNITIVDDAVQAKDIVTDVPNTPVQSYHLVFTLDLSGSMVNESGTVHFTDGTSATRLEMAQEALVRLATEYFSQSNDVTISFVTFASNARIQGVYTDLDAFVSAIGGTTASGATNYEAALTAMQEALDSDHDGTLDDTSVQTITYFISDGEPTAGNTSDPVGASHWDEFLAHNPVQSYAVAIGSGIDDFSILDQIHNIDADGSGASDGTILVPVLSDLESALLSTVPAAYGGTLVSDGYQDGVVLGADGGHIQSITIDLDTNADLTPDTVVTFAYDPAAGQITNDGGFPALDGHVISLDAATHGFSQGTLIFDFESGKYTYYPSTSISEGDRFTIGFTAVDGDGDAASPASLTLNVVDGQPVANNDTDTLFANQTALQGNVISGLGTDGGVALGQAVTGFARQGEGVDEDVDNAQVTAITYRGDVIDLTTDSAGTNIMAGADGSTYSYTVADGRLTLTNADGSSLIFNRSGYYHYVPDYDPTYTPPIMLSESFKDGSAGQGTSLTNPVLGAGFSRIADSGQYLSLGFDTDTHRQGVESVTLTFDRADISVGGGITIYHIDGHVLGTLALNATTIEIPDSYSNIGRIEIVPNGDGAGWWDADDAWRLARVDFTPVTLDTGSAALTPEIIEYTLTDADGQSDTATLTLNTVYNSFVGDAGDDSINGTGTNDLISGLDGNDTLAGGQGHDILEGGAGNDRLEGGEGHDHLVGDLGNDILVGGDGDDLIFGGTGDDLLKGGAGNDALYGGEGGDTFVWGQNDQGTVGTPAEDIVHDFDHMTGGTAGGDVLDLRDLLQGEEQNPLTDYLCFTSNGTDTTIHIDPGGGAFFQETQKIILSGVDLTSGGTLGDQEIINHLLASKNLMTD